jgi:predicted nucleic acid-binding protein
MINGIYYLDTCIWINLWKKEGDPSKGIPYWKIAHEFIRNAEAIVLTPIVIKEIKYKLTNADELIRFLRNSEFIKLESTVSEDYYIARVYEREHGTISFADYLHVAIAKRLDIPLITRDKKLIEFAKQHIRCHKPEELIK